MKFKNIFEKFNKKGKDNRSNSSPEYYEIESTSFEQEFKKFLSFSKTLEADEDVVHGIPREYVSTAKLNPAYRAAFEGKGAPENTIRYRIRAIDQKEFPDDFMIVPGERNPDQQEYFVNRLNEGLLKKIYMPVGDSEMINFAEQVKLAESDLQGMDDLAVAMEDSRRIKHVESPIEDEEYHDEHEYLGLEKE